MKYFYADLSPHDYGFFRIGGPGLANCLIIAARAYINSVDANGYMIRPTWERLGLGQWIRREKDKRFYYGLFKKNEIKDVVRDLFIRGFFRNVIKISGLGMYFADLLPRRNEILMWLNKIIESDVTVGIPADLSSAVAVHIRLGDYRPPYRVEVSWYCKAVRALMGKSKRFSKIMVFSDGSDSELTEILSMPNTERAFYGNALADLIAMSRCGCLIGSDSTFSGWSAFIGQMPCIFPHLHFNRPNEFLIDNNKCMILDPCQSIPDIFICD